MLRKIPIEFLKKFEFAKEMIFLKYQNWDYFKEFFCDNKEIVLYVLSKDGKKLFDCSKELQDDEEIVEVAVSQNGTSLLFASDRLKENLKFVKQMLKNNPELIHSCSKNIQENIEIILFSKKMYPELYLNEKIKKKLSNLNFHFYSNGNEEEFKYNSSFEFKFSNLEISEFPKFDFGSTPTQNSKIEFDFGFDDKFSFSPNESLINKKTPSPLNNNTSKQRVKRSTPKKKFISYRNSPALDENFLSIDEMNSLEESLQKFASESIPEQ